MIKNKKTGLLIEDKDIYSKNENGIVVTNKYSWKFIPNEDLEEVQELEKIAPQYNSAVYPNDSNSETKSYVEKVKYDFGFDHLKFGNRVFNKTSAIYSEDINVKDVDYITITTIEDLAYNSSVEYYIVDGTTETSILPENQKQVIKEKLFFGLSTRFDIDNTASKDPILYRNNDIISDKTDYKRLTFFDYMKNEYTLTYYPNEGCNKYIPSNDTVKVKVIIRNFTDTFSPAIIKGITVNKYGKKLEWI